MMVAHNRAKGSISCFLIRKRLHVPNILQFLLYFRYKKGSIKDSTWQCRDKGASRVYTLRETTRLPPQKVAFTVATNKVQLINLIWTDLINNKEDITQHKLVVTGSETVPIEINNGVVMRQQDMSSTHEDTIIVQHLYHKERHKTALVVTDDTDIFILLLHFVHSANLTNRVMMMSPIQGRTVIDINETVRKHQDIIPSLLAAHWLTGCDTVATYFGIGKGITLKILRSGLYTLGDLGDTNKPVSSVVPQAQRFILACYGQVHCESLTEARIKVWSTKVGKTLALAKSKSHCLQPTGLSSKTWPVHISKLPYGEMLSNQTLLRLMQLIVVGPKTKTLSASHLRWSRAILS